MVFFKNFKNIFLIPELSRKLLVTVGILVIYRIGSFIPVVGINLQQLAQYMSSAKAVGGLLSYLDTISAGNLSQCTLFTLGIGPYITASIMMQLLSFSVPYFEQLTKEGDYGYKILNQYTRYLTFGLSVMYSLSYATFLERANLVWTPGWAFKIVFVLSLTVGSMFVMWLGEQISLLGVGNGSSMLIFAGIVSRFFDYGIKTVVYVSEGTVGLFMALFIIVIYLVITACIVFLEKGERKIPVQYARRIVGQRVYGGQSTFIPFKINTAGVMPVIFASSMLNVPIFIARMFSQKFALFQYLASSLEPTKFLFNVLQFALIVFFTYFYTELVFNPDKLSEQLKKNGGFIPGIRPGKSTADYFFFILTRIGLVGAIYLGILSVLPNAMAAFISPMPFYVSGTSLLIVVGVALEFSAQIESYLIEHRYEGFLTSGRMKNGVSMR
ncbi:MAG: preprotein translocase subunit SecY [Candidatus Babeliaceae bacterium]|nr:preprotein translocase subunit SecY [Candidatus Babeliaceae bacterium]